MHAAGVTWVHKRNASRWNSDKNNTTKSGSEDAVNDVIQPSGAGTDDVCQAPFRYGERCSYLQYLPHTFKPEPCMQGLYDSAIFKVLMLCFSSVLHEVLRSKHYNPPPPPPPHSDSEFKQLNLRFYQNSAYRSFGASQLFKKTCSRALAHSLTPSG